MQNKVLGAGTNADLGSPDAQARTHIVAGASTLVMAPGLLIHGVGEPVAGPDLSTVCVAAELEVNARSLGLFQVVGLVVQEDGKTIGPIHK